jgi:hypothetical protein
VLREATVNALSLGWTRADHAVERDGEVPPVQRSTLHRAGPDKDVAQSLPAGVSETGGTLAIGEVAVPVDSENLASESSPKCSKLMLNTTSEMAIAPSLGKLPTPAPLYCAVMSPTKLALPRPTFGQAEIWTWRVSGKDSSRIDVAREHLSFPRARLEGSSLRRPTSDEP